MVTPFSFKPLTISHISFRNSTTQINNFVKLNDTSIKFLQPDIARYGGISQIISLKDKIVTDKLKIIITNLAKTKKKKAAAKEKKKGGGFSFGDYDLRLNEAIFEKDDKSYIIIDFNNQIREANEY